MKTYIIKHLESNTPVGTIKADKFVVGEAGVVVFYTQGQLSAVTQISGSTLIYEESTPQPALVVPFATSLRRA